MELTSTAGYGEQAQFLAERFERVSFEQVHATVLPFLDLPPGRAVDIGAGSGRDAAALAARGHEVTAVEPVPELRAIAQALHADAGIRWVADELPELRALDGPFGLVMATAVWMHLTTAERAQGMRRVAGLLGPGGRLMLSLRHGPVPAGRRMFDVDPAEVISAAAALDLRLLHRGPGTDLQRRHDVTWTVLVLEAR
jgi:SAM-dependent methyltransferase